MHIRWSSRCCATFASSAPVQYPFVTRNTVSFGRYSTPSERGGKEVGELCAECVCEGIERIFTETNGTNDRKNGRRGTTAADPSPGVPAELRVPAEPTDAHSDGCGGKKAVQEDKNNLYFQKIAHLQE